MPAEPRYLLRITEGNDDILGYSAWPRELSAATVLSPPSIVATDRRRHPLLFVRKILSL